MPKNDRKRANIRNLEMIFGVALAGREGKRKSDSEITILANISTTMGRGAFILFEGLDRSGKTTQVSLSPTFFFLFALWSTFSCSFRTANLLTSHSRVVVAGVEPKSASLLKFLHEKGTNTLARRFPGTFPVHTLFTVYGWNAIAMRIVDPGPSSTLVTPFSAVQIVRQPSGK